MTIIKTGGQWDPARKPIYFFAGGHVEEIADTPDLCVLLGAERVNETMYPLVEEFFERGVPVFLDSGIFPLTNAHKRAHGITMNEALALHPTEIDGFDWLWDRYTTLIRRYGDQFWGYTELDQGGRDVKRETRKRLHDLGIKPMPVYHPLNDGWDYFDELAETHDRIAFGNVVQASYPLRKRLVATAYERKQAYPHLWIHLLGFTPNQWLNGMPMESCDSSTWMGALRWGPMKERAMLQPVGVLPRDFSYMTRAASAYHDIPFEGTIDGPAGTRRSYRMVAGSFIAAMKAHADWLRRTGQLNADDD